MPCCKEVVIAEPAEGPRLWTNVQHTLQELASSASVMRLTKMRWRGPLVPLIAAVVRNATQRLMQPSSNVTMQLNAQNILDIFHSAAVHAFHPGDGLFLQTVLKVMEIRFARILSTGERPGSVTVDLFKFHIEFITFRPSIIVVPA